MFNISELCIEQKEHSETHNLRICSFLTNTTEINFNSNVKSLIGCSLKKNELRNEQKKMLEITRQATAVGGETESTFQSVILCQSKDKS